MVAKDDLYQLIRSLTTSEKRYFKVFASRHTSAEDHNLNDLFDEIDRLDEYDEDKLKKGLSKKKENRSVVKYLSAEKKALQDLIMRAMRSYHGEKTVDVQLHELMMDEMFYHGKSLYELQSKTLYKAKKLAEEYEKFPQLLILLQREAKMLIERKTKDYDEVRYNVHRQEKEIVEKMVNECELRRIKDDIFLYERTGVNTRDQNFQKEIELKIDKYLLSEDKALSFHALRHYHNILRVYYKLKLDIEKSWKHSGEIIKLFETHPKIKVEYSFDYKIALANYLGACHLTPRYNEFGAILSKIKSVPSRSIDEEGEVFQNVALYQVLYFLNTGKFSDAVKIIPEIEAGMKLYSAKINKGQELTLYYNITLLFFILEENKHALHWVNKIINDKSDSRKDIQHFSRILELILQYEMGKNDLLEYMTRSAYRYLEKEGRLHGFERILLNYLKKFPFALNNNKLLESFEILKNEIEKMKNSPTEKTQQGMEEMILWLSSKIEGRSMQEILKQIY